MVKSLLASVTSKVKPISFTILKVTENTLGKVGEMKSKQFSCTDGSLKISRGSGMLSC